jgi:hypothetical protein
VRGFFYLWDSGRPLPATFQARVRPYDARCCRKSRGLTRSSRRKKHEKIPYAGKAQQIGNLGDHRAVSEWPCRPQALTEFIRRARQHTPHAWQNSALRSGCRTPAVCPILVSLTRRSYALIGCIALRRLCFADEQLSGCLHQSLRRCQEFSDACRSMEAHLCATHLPTEEPEK